MLKITIFNVHLEGLYYIIKAIISYEIRRMNSNARYTTTGWLNSVIDNLSDCYDKNNGIYVIIMACTGCLREEFTLFEQGFFGFFIK